MLTNVYVIAVCDIVVVCDIRNNAESLLQALGELICSRLQRSAVQRVVDVFCFFPFCALIIHILHDRQRERFCFRIGVTLSGHILHTLIQAGVTQADGGIAAEQQLVDLFTLLQAGQCAVLPQDTLALNQLNVPILLPLYIIFILIVFNIFFRLF